MAQTLVTFHAHPDDEAIATGLRHRLTLGTFDTDFSGGKRPQPQFIGYQFQP